MAVEARYREVLHSLGLRCVADLPSVGSISLGIVLPCEPLRAFVPKSICKATSYLESYRVYIKATASLQEWREAVALLLGDYGLGI